MLRRLHTFLLLILLASRGLFAQDKPVDMLILSTHTASSEWEQRMLGPVLKLVLDRDEWDVSVHRFQLLSHPDVASLERSRDSVLNAQKVPPRLVILVGGSCFQFARDVQNRWEDIPILLLGEQDYYSDIDYALNGPGDPDARRYPVADLRDQGLNLTLICAPALIRRTVEMILTVQPELDKMIFVAGENYQSKEHQWRWEQFMREQHPDINCQIISSANTTTDQLMTLLDREDKHHTAVFFGSWLIRKGYLENISTRHNTVSLIEPIIPVYTLFGVESEKHPYVVGYHSYSKLEYERAVQQRICDVLDMEIRPDHMAFTYLETGISTLNYQAMRHFGLNTELIPEDALIFDGPRSLWQRIKRIVVWGTFFLIIGLAAFIFTMKGRSLHSLRKARNAAEKANRLKTAFIQSMSHDVSTQLNSLIGFAQELGKPGESLSMEDKNECLESVMNKSQLLTVMVNDLLSIADMEQGRFAINKAPVNLNEMARQAIKTIEPLVASGVSLVRQPGLDENALYMADGMRVQQVMINLLTNACKHTHEGEIVFGSTLWEHPGFITFFVSDPSTAVTQTLAAKIMDRFSTVESNDDESELNLSICQMVASNLGGKVWLDIDYKEGTRFYFTIPKEEA